MAFTKYQTATVANAGGLGPLSRQHLADAITRTKCAFCGRRVPVKERAVVKVDDEHRVFHLGCSETGPIELERRALRRRYRSVTAYERQIAALRRG